MTAIQNVQETSEIEDQNARESAYQNVQENAPDAEATQSKNLKLQSSSLCFQAR
jgi:hypothetical protein